MSANPPSAAETYEIWAASRTFRNPGPNPQREVDWVDRPGKFCVISGATRVALPAGISSPDLTIGLPRQPSSNGIRVGELSDLLLLCGGILRRRLSIVWSRKVAGFDNGKAPFARGVASGGGLYPYCIYLISLSGEPLQQGIYHYDVAHHGLHRVRMGLRSAQLSASLPDAHVQEADFLIVVVGRFWQAAFKYGNFAYKVMMQDVGALLGGMEQVACSLSWDATMLHWFKDAALSELLGLEEKLEAPFVAVAVRRAGRASSRPRSAERAFAPHRGLAHAERSKHVQSLDFLLDVHSSTCLDDTRPRPDAVRDIAPMSSYQDRIGPLAGASLTAAFLNRETSWGQTVDWAPMLRADQLLTAIRFAFSSPAYASDLYSSAHGLPLLRVGALIRSVEGFPAGLYAYDSSTAQLTMPRTDFPADLLRQIYRAKEHNTEQMPAVLIVIGKIREAIDHFGPRGVRVMNAEAGMFAQRAYLSCAALSLGCGAVLGFDALALREALRLDIEKEVPLLVVFIGARRPKTTAFDFCLV